MSDDKKILAKNFIWNTLGTGINSFNSLFFLIIVTRINGLDMAGIFSIAYATATILYTLALYSGRLCQVTDIENRIKDKDYITNRALTCFIMLICATLYLCSKQYTAFKTGVFVVLILFRGIEAFADILYGVMQKNGVLYKAGMSLTAKGIIGLLLFGIIDFFTKNLIYSGIALIVINIILLIAWDYFSVTRKLIDRTSKINKNNVISILKSEFFVFVNSFAGIYILNAPKYAIDTYLTDNLQAIYGYIMMPATVMTLFTQFIVMPVLGQLKELYEKKDFKQFRSVIFKIKMIVLAFGTFAVLAAFLLGPEFLGLIYGVKLTDYRMNLCVIIASYIFYANTYINLVQLTTVRHTFVQFVIYVTSMIIAAIGSNILVKNFGINGATFSCTTTLALQFLMYLIVTKVIMKKVEKESLEKE